MRPLPLRSRSCLLATAALLLTACTIRIGPLDMSEGFDDTPSPLPDPPNSMADPPSLDDAQKARKLEVDNFIANVTYQGGTIRTSYQLPSGDIVDFIERDSLPALPFGLPQVPWAPEDLTPPPGVSFGLTEFEQIPELVALAAEATPFIRPTFWAYILGETDATSIDDYLDRYTVGGQPTGSDALHAGLEFQAPNRGVSGFMNQFRPDVQPDSFSLMEFAVACPTVGPTQEMIGVVISVDKVNDFGRNGQPLQDGEPRMHIEYATMDDATGKIRYRWDGRKGEFKPNPLRTHQVGGKVPFSVIGGNQIEHLASIFQAPTGDWWIAFGSELLGYYPSALFSQLNGGGCRTLWYGEVARRTSANTTGWVKTEMGSGRFAQEGIPNVAYVRNPKYYDFTWFSMEPIDIGQSIPIYRPLCYSRENLTNGVITIGGAGGKNPGCVGP